MYDGNAATVIGRRVGNYVVERSLAQGNMGAVFVARHPALGREAAVKFLGRDLDSSPEMTKRFLDEARITANLRHPNIVDIFDFGELDGRLYYVMELLDGVDLAALLRARRRFAIAEVVEFLRQICSGLAAAHAAGVVHRDLKPGNIFVVRERPARLKLMDFGVAKILSTTGEQTHHGQIIGTPRYMCPEQALGQIDRISPQSDIYSLGVIAYEMLAGRSPFEHQSPVMLLVMHVHNEVYPLDDLAPEAPAWLVSLVEDCLAKEPSKRPASALEILARIARWHTPTGPDDSDSHFALPMPEVGSGHSETRIPIAARTGIAERQSTIDATTSSIVSVRHAASDTVQSLVSDSALAELDGSARPLQAGSAQVDPPVQPSPEPAAPLDRNLPRTAAPIALTDADRTVLNRLLFRMQRRGDFPAFVQNVGEVSKRADFESSFSAEQLGTAILKDYALTAKLLRIVNSAYANRFGGRIYSIRHAIVILGFDRVRSLALSTSLFKSQGNEKHAGRISESAINALVSGEIARQVCSDAELEDAEQATVCSMFRNLGRHLVLVYLPELYDDILQLMERQGVGMNLASERVLGLSMHKLGVGIAERWRLPSKIIGAMSSIPERSGRLTREEDKLAALAEFSNGICEIVTGEYSTEQRTAALKTLLGRHKNLVQLEEDELKELMQSTQKSFEQRYASLLGAATRDCRFARAVATLSGQEAPNAVKEAAAVQRAIVCEQQSRDPGNPVAVTPGVLRDAKPKRQITRLQLAKRLEPETKDPGSPSGLAHASLDSLAAKALGDSQSSPVNELLISLLQALAQELTVPRLLAIRAAQSRRELVPVAGIGEDVDGILKELRIPLLPARTATDPFSLCYHAHRDFLIEDVFAPRLAALLPQRYFEVIGSSALGLISCTHPASQPLVLLMDVDPPRQLPDAARFATLTRVRMALARIAPLASL
jgi:serine/threonine protein kinase/HD-like signal output (HDOD) protein